MSEDNSSSQSSGTSELDLRKMYLAGTVAIPAAPAKATVTVEQSGSGREGFFLVKAEQCLSAKVTVSRTFFQDDVRAIYIAADKSNKSKGWTAGKAAVNGLLKKHLGENGFDGVLHVREDAQSLLETKAGLTASENAEYYPPMPQERSSVGHYNLKRTGCLQDECCDYPPDDGGNECCEDDGSCGCGC